MSQIRSDNIKLNAPKLIDDRAGNTALVGAVYTTVPYANVAQANATISPAYRAVGLTVNILVGGVLTEFWYKNGILDTDLINKTSTNTITNFGGASNIATIPTVADFATLSTVGLIGVIVQEFVRGGIFDLYTGVNPADNGLIFLDGAARKWKRQTSVNYVNINWFGAVADGATDNLAIFNAAKTSASVNLSYTRIYVPKTPANLFYQMSDSIILDTQVEIFGDSSESKIRFALHKAGFIFNYITTRFSKIHDILVRGTIGAAGTWDATANGIVIRDIIELNNVTAEQFEGNGFYAWNSIPSGNSSNSVFYNCHAYQNRIHGFSFSGSDANNMQIILGDAITNGGLGFNDQSFLGNNYNGLHAASNGSPEASWQRGLVISGGITYAAKINNFSNIAPPDATYWKSLGALWATGYPSVLAYNAATIYYAVGSWNADGMNAAPVGTGQNQHSSFISCYAEADQAPSYMGQRCIAIGGNSGSGYQSPSKALEVESSVMYTLGDIGAGNPNASTPKNYVTPNDGFKSMVGGDGMRMLYDAVNKAIIWNPIQYGAGSAGSLKVYNVAAATAAVQNRINILAYVGSNNGYMWGTVEDRSKNIVVDMARLRPTVINYDLGDLMINGGTLGYWFDEYPDIVGWKKVATGGAAASQWSDIHAYADYTITTTDAVATTFKQDQYDLVKLPAQYSIDLIATNTVTGAVYSLKIIYTFGTTVGVSAAYPLILKSTLTEYSFTDAGLTGISLSYTISGTPVNLISWQVNGLAATNIQWKISMKRLKML